MSGYSSQEININHMINQFPNILVEQAKRRLQGKSTSPRGETEADRKKRRPALGGPDAQDSLIV